MSTSRRLTKGFLATLLSQLIAVVGNLVLVPIFLAHWGETRYGEWLLLYAAIAYMTVVDFGVQAFVVNRLNQAYARREMADYHRTLHSALALSLTVCGAVLALVVVVFWLVPIGDWFDFAFIDDATAAFVAILLGVQLIGAIPQGIISGIYRTLGEYPLGVMIANVRRVMTFGLTAAVIALGGGPLEVAAAQLAPLALVTLYTWIDLRRRHPEIAIGLRHGTRRDAIALLGPSFYFFLIQLSAGLVLQGTTLVVGGVLGTTVVVLFTATRTLANVIVQVTGSVNATLAPDVTSLEARDRYATLREVQRLSAKTVLALTLAAAAFLHFNGDFIMRVWTNGAVTYDADLMTVFLLYVLYLSYLNTTTLVLVAANRHRRTAILTVVATALGVLLSVPFALGLGVTGVILALLVVDVLVRGAALTLEACRFIAQPTARYLIDVLGRGAVVAGVGFGATGGFAALAGEPSIVVTVVSAMIAGIAVMAMTLLVWLDGPERRRVLRLVRLAR